MTTEKFQDYDKAKEYVIRQGFDYYRPLPISMGEGYEHICILEYNHKTNPESVCRIADLRFEQYKRKTEDEMPRIIGFVQVSIKEQENEDIGLLQL